MASLHTNIPSPSETTATSSLLVTLPSLPPPPSPPTPTSLPQEAHPALPCAAANPAPVHPHSHPGPRRALHTPPNPSPRTPPHFNPPPHRPLLTVRPLTRPFPDRHAPASLRSPASSQN